MCYTLCFYDTQGRGRAVLRHAPHVVVMTAVGYPRSWEGHDETCSPCCCDDDGLMPTRRVYVRYSADAIALRFLCSQVGEADIYFYTSI